MGEREASRVGGCPSGLEAGLAVASHPTGGSQRTPQGPTPASADTVAVGQGRRRGPPRWLEGQGKFQPPKCSYPPDGGSGSDRWESPQRPCTAAAFLGQRLRTHMSTVPKVTQKAEAIAHPPAISLQRLELNSSPRVGRPPQTKAGAWWSLEPRAGGGPLWPRWQSKDSLLTPTG